MQGGCSVDTHLHNTLHNIHPHSNMYAWLTHQLHQRRWHGSQIWHLQTSLVRYIVLKRAIPYMLRSVADHECALQGMHAQPQRNDAVVLRKYCYLCIMPLDNTAGIMTISIVTSNPMMFSGIAAPTSRHSDNQPSHIVNTVACSHSQL